MGILVRKSKLAKVTVFMLYDSMGITMRVYNNETASYDQGTNTFL